MAVIKLEEVKLLEIYNGIDKEIKNMIEQMRNAKEIVNKLNNKDSWAGNGFNYYEKKFNALATNFGAYCNEVFTLNNSIKKAISDYKQTDRNVIGKL